ncbi:MAG: extracellular solute-binding protein, partial [Clostridiales bacterium]|nr:extracellular solute-binding protein [Clostridiales bacterium]
DDELPFAEAENISFGFSYDWQIKVIGEEEPYLFYFEAGREYTLKLENTLGVYADILRETQNCVLALNEVYRQVKMVVGASADNNRDYAIDKQLPQCMETLREQYNTLQSLAAETEQVSGEKGNGYGAYQRLFVQIEDFLEDPDKLPKQLDFFSNNISSLADYTLSASEQPLLLDYIMVATPEQEIPRVQDSFWQKLVFECRSFLASFVTDYNMVGDASETNSSLDLWLSSGRDQAEVVKQLIDNGFTKEYGTTVNVRLVTADMILPAAAAGRGPDVAVAQEKALPVRYGLRNALLDLAQFPDVDEVLKRFHSSAYAPFFVEDKLYALPDTQNFLMMYVRTDILADLGMKIPNTWQDLYHCLYTLQQHNLGIGFPNIDFTSVSDNNIEMFYLLLFQHGGTLFTEDLSRTRLDEAEAVSAFTEWSELYTKYKVTQQMNHLTRFRTGEAPIVLFNMSFYNTLSLYAPEIKGLWKLCAVPGTLREDGTIDRSIGSTPTGAVAFATTKSPEECWKFLKWWTSAETQTGYASGMENALGASGRVLTANLEAFDNLAWPVDDRKTIAEQRSYIRDIPEIAGSYVFDRYLCTAVRYTIEKNADPREILLEWNKKINVENQIRRKEFGLE